MNTSPQKVDRVKGDAVIVIMAGGSGERFWPVSNRSTPKQLLRLHGDKTMLESSFDRAAKLVPADRVYIVAGDRLKEAIYKVLPALQRANYISEPFARNTSACLGLAACHVEARHGGGAVMGVLTADHVIDDGAVFQSEVRAAMAHAAATNDLVTLGIQPTHPDTGFGYLELGGKVADYETGDGHESVYRVTRFAEKPDRERAEKFLKQGNYLWNSGMFFWKAESLLNAFEEHQPAMAAQWRRLRGTDQSTWSDALTAEIFNTVPSLPIDTAIMEKSDRVAAVAGRFPWDDVGSWDALARIRETDENGNCRIGPSIVLDSRNNIIYNDVSGVEGLAPEIVLQGIDDMIVVRTDKAILITPKSRVQEVKTIVRHLNEAKRNDLT